MVVEVNTAELARFLVRAKKATYAGEGAEVPPQRPEFRELEYVEGDWNYRDSYTGYYAAPGQEVVRFQDRPIWVMSYNGGVVAKYIGNLDLAKQAFSHLKRALLEVSEDFLFRGPKMLRDGEWNYRCNVEGNIESFSGIEYIRRTIIDEGILISEDVFQQQFFGGLVIHRELK